MMEKHGQEEKHRLINRVRKEALVRTAENLVNSPDWRSTGRTMRRLMNQLKGIPSAGRTEDERLWARFQSAYQIYLDHRSREFDRGNREKRNRLQEQILGKQKQAADLQEAMRLAQSRVHSFEEMMFDVPEGVHQTVIRNFISETITTVQVDVKTKERELKTVEKMIADLADRSHSGG